MPLRSVNPNGIQIHQPKGCGARATLGQPAKTFFNAELVASHPARFACTGKPSGPSLYHLLEVLGKDRALARMDAALTA